MTNLLQAAAVTDWTIPLVVVLAIAGAFTLRWQIRTYHRPQVMPRPDRHLPADEYRLLGDDYLKCVQPFFRGRKEHDARSAYAIHHVCFPENNEPRTAGTVEALTDKELSLGSHRK